MMMCKLCDAPGQATGGSAYLATPPAPLTMDRAGPATDAQTALEPEAAAAQGGGETPRDTKLAAIGLSVYLDQVGVGDDEQVLEKAYVWVQAQKPTSVGDIVQFNMVDDFVNALDLPIIPKTKLLGALKPQAAGIQVVSGIKLVVD